MRFSKEYTVRFTVPAFLGDAGQGAAWRTPPFKALLRQWWRVAAAPDYGFDHQKLREAEGRLFGHAWLRHGNDHWSMQSKLRIRLNNASKERVNNWPPENQPFLHLEAKHSPSADLYLGFGPIQTRNRVRSALPRDAQANLRLAMASSVTDQDVQQLRSTMQLIHWFGAIGSRSRNAWGSIYLDDETIKQLSPDQDLSVFARPLRECLQLEWPHAIGRDGQGQLLIWTTRAISSWQTTVKDLAQIKAELLRSLPKQKGVLSERHILNYPVTNAEMAKSKFERIWPKEARYASQLRLKIFPDEDGFRGMFFHLPCGLANHFVKKVPKNSQAWLKENELPVWQKVHRFLDDRSELSRFEGVSA